jgi:hypothetical protein
MDALTWVIIALVIVVVLSVGFVWLRISRRSGTVLAASPDREERE